MHRLLDALSSAAGADFRLRRRPPAVSRPAAASPASSGAAAFADPFADVLGTELPPPADALFAEALGGADLPPAFERRGGPRKAAAWDALVRPVDRDHRPAGPPVRAVVADVSSDGLRVLHDELLPAEFLAVRLDDGRWRPTILVFRAARVVASESHYEYAGPIVLCADAPAWPEAAVLARRQRAARESVTDGRRG